MTMLKKQLFILLSLMLTSIAGAQDYYTTIDILRPGRVTFPKEAQHVLVVNNAVNQPHDYAHQSRLMGQITSNVTIDTDSALLYFLTAFSQTLEDQEFFGSVDLLETTQNTSERYFEQHSMTGLQIDHLRKMYDADAIITLNRLLLSDMLEDYLTTDEDYYAYLEVHCVSIWHIYMPGQERPTAITLSDTLLWENRDYRRSDAIDALPNRRDALLDMAIYSAQSIGRRLVPHWEQRDRYFYYHSDKQMQAGMDSLYHKKWEGAIGEWYSAYERGNTKLKACAAANMASAFEIEGDLRSAYFWAQRAAEHFGDGLLTNNKQQQEANMRAYANELQMRIKEEDLLQLQY